MAKKNDMAVAPVKSEFPLIDETLLKSRIYTIRGLKVMLDADLAEIYGYSTKSFNQQVKNNIEKFDDDFRFQLTRTEYREILGSKFLTLEQGKYSKTSPYAFTEQGIYMLMTVLKGEQATAQSKALIRLFKQMKDYIAAENAPDVSAGMVALATQRRGEQDHDHHAVGRYRGVPRTVREAVAKGGMITAFTFFP